MSTAKFLLKDFVQTRFRTISTEKLKEMLAKAKVFDLIGKNAYTMWPNAFREYVLRNQLKLPFDIMVDLKDNSEQSWTEFLTNKEIENFLNQRMMSLSSFTFRQKLDELSDTDKKIMKQDVELIAHMFKMVEKNEIEQQPLRYIQLKTNTPFDNPQDTQKLIEENVVLDE